MYCYKKAIETSTEKFYIEYLNLGSAYIEKHDIYNAVKNLKVAIEKEHPTIKNTFQAKGYNNLFEEP